MPSIRPISDLRNSANESFQTSAVRPMSRFMSPETVLEIWSFLNLEEFERREALIDLYAKLAVAEEEIARGDEGEDFLAFARQLREQVHGTL